MSQMQNNGIKVLKIHCYTLLSIKKAQNLMHPQTVWSTSLFFSLFLLPKLRQAGRQTDRRMTNFCRSKSSLYLCSLNSSSNCERYMEVVSPVYRKHSAEASWNVVFLHNTAQVQIVPPTYYNPLILSGVNFGPAEGL